MYFTAQNQGNIPATYDCDVCEGNWYEDRCTSQYDTKKKRDYLLPNPNAWQYETTYSDLGQNCKDYPTIKKHFQIANDDCINFQGMDYNMFIDKNKRFAMITGSADEIRGLKNDKIMTSRAVEFEKNRWAEKLKGSVGKDIDDVLSGKKKVKLTFNEVINYKLKYYKNKVLKMFNKNEE